MAEIHVINKGKLIHVNLLSDDGKSGVDLNYQNASAISPAALTNRKWVAAVYRTIPECCGPDRIIHKYVFTSDPIACVAELEWYSGIYSNPYVNVVLEYLKTGSIRNRPNKFLPDRLIQDGSTLHKSRQAYLVAMDSQPVVPIPALILPAIKRAFEKTVPTMTVNILTRTKQIYLNDASKQQLKQKITAELFQVRGLFSNNSDEKIAAGANQLSEFLADKISLLLETDDQGNFSIENDMIRDAAKAWKYDAASPSGQTIIFEHPPLPGSMNNDPARPETFGGAIQSGAKAGLKDATSKATSEAAGQLFGLAKGLL